MAVNDDKLSRLHQARPAGTALHLRGAELEARGLEQFTKYEPSIAARLKVPSFESGERLAWPPPQPFWFAPVALGGDPRHFTDRCMR